VVELSRVCGESLFPSGCGAGSKLFEQSCCFIWRPQAAHEFRGREKECVPVLRRNRLIERSSGRGTERRSQGVVVQGVRDRYVSTITAALAATVMTAKSRACGGHRLSDLIARSRPLDKLLIVTLTRCENAVHVEFTFTAHGTRGARCRVTLH